MEFMYTTISLNYEVVSYTSCPRAIQIKSILRKVRFMTSFHNFLFYNKQRNKLTKLYALMDFV
jgi:hypothetical protein